MKTLAELKSDGWIERCEARQILDKELIQKHVKFYGNVLKGVVYRKLEGASDDRVVIIEIQIVDPSESSLYDDRKLVCRLESSGFMCSDVKNQIGQLGAYVKLFRADTLRQMINDANEQAKKFLENTK